MEDQKPAVVGSKIAFVAQFLGRRLAGTYEIKAPAGFAKVGAPMMAAAMRRANRKDLRRLKTILEAAPR